MTLDRLEAYRACRTALESVTGEFAECETQVAVQSAATPPYSLHTATLTGLPSTPRVISLLERQAALRASCFAVERFRRDLDNFLGKYARALAKRGADKPKWVKTIEVGSRSGRIHAHLFSACEPFYNDESGLYYLHMRFVRKGARLDL